MRRSTLTFIVLLIGVFLLNGFATVAQEDIAQRNKQIYLDMVAAYNAGNRDVFYDLVTDPFMMNQGETVLAETTRADIEGYDGALAAAMPDIQMTPAVVIAQDDWLAVQVTYTGTFTEPFSFPPFGPDPFPANNEGISWTEMDFLHFNADGQVDQAWIMGDPMVMFGQMGMFPAQEGEVPGTPLESPAGYQALSADELAATFTSGMEARNLQRITEEAAQPLGDTQAPMQYYADPYIIWNNAAPYSVAAADTQGDAAFLGMLKQAMPDVATEPLTIVVSEGDWVAAVVKLSGTFTNDADFFGMPLTHTDQQIEWMFGGMNRYNADGMVVEQWIEGDASPLLQGLGLMPAFGEE